MKNDCARSQTCYSACDGNWWCKSFFEELRTEGGDDCHQPVDVAQVLAIHPVDVLPPPKLRLAA